MSDDAREDDSITASLWTQLCATAHYWHSLYHDGELSDCPKRVCRRAREVAGEADAVYGFEAIAARIRGEMHEALKVFGETLPDDDEAVH